MEAPSTNQRISGTRRLPAESSCEVKAQKALALQKQADGAFEQYAGLSATGPASVFQPLG